ncbi:MAG: sulfotransferase domain-containing protein [Bacteroidales bacterium]|nr:sulfotransferase domain-containing protein [Bacteroidales bacterium]
MNLPTFILAGAQKAGTTSMFNILKQHSQIFLPKTKEIHFFDINKNYKQGIDWYAGHFKDSENYICRGEVTPNYMFADYVPERIYNSSRKDIKLIYILRNPADRAFSHYKMRVGRGFEKNPFKYSVKLNVKELNLKSKETDHNYITRGFYSEQIKRYLEYFEIKNMFFILFEEDFLSNRKKTIQNLLKFLQVNENEKIGIDIQSIPGGKSKSEKANKILNTPHPINQFAKKIIPSKKLRTNIKYFITKLNQKPTADKSELEEIRPFLINEIYKDSILELEKIINRDLSSWYNI